MFRIIPSEERHFADFGWLKTHWLFSFSDYYNPDNIRFGALRAFNDDIVEPGMGFPPHPHHEMEIVTIVLNGKITHKDSGGHRNVIGPGEVQRMSAGTGLTHSEFNRTKEPVHLYQIWFFPNEAGLEPSYEQKSFDSSLRLNRFYPVASGLGHAGAVSLHADAVIYRARLEPSGRIDYEVGENRKAFLYVGRGELDLSGHTVRENDQARVDMETKMKLTSEMLTDLVLIDVASCRGWGYDARTLRGARA
jgi:redox-sensitive bicupin YhaK (pirin superfamily)